MHEEWWDQHLKQVGAFIKEQRRLAELSQREFARTVNLSDTYMSQLERGMHEPSIRVLRAIADGLNLSADQLIAFAAGLGGQPSSGREATTEEAIRADPRLDLSQKQALLSVLRSYLAASGTSTGEAPPGPPADGVVNVGGVEHAEGISSTVNTRATTLNAVDRVNAVDTANSVSTPTGATSEAC